MGKKSGSGPGMNNLDHISELKYLFFDADPGSGLEKIRIRMIRDVKNSDPDPGSGINILDPQH
jgi:hypothetical protein